MSRYFGGYIPTARPKDQKSFSAVYKRGGKSDGAGKTTFLWDYYRKAVGHEYVTRHQLSTPSCVGQSVACCVDMLRAVRIGGLGLREVFEAPADAITIYGGARFEIAYKKHGQRGAIRGAGTSVHYAIEFLKDYGTLLMKPYSGYDLSEFSEKRCNSWGKSGVPDELEKESRYRILLASLSVDSYEEAIAALQYGFPVAIGCGQGFAGQSSRDSEGFLKPKGSWSHAMAIVGYDDRGERPGVCCQNSWGTNWVKGPKRFNQPDGSFWIDRDVFDKMCRNGDASALTDLGNPSA